MALIAITKTKRIKINRECIDEPIALYWRNKLNNVDMWVFSRRQTEVLSSASGGSYEHYNEDLAIADSREDYVSKINQDSMIVGADNLLEEDIRGIKGLLEAPKVEILVSQNPYVFKTVQLVPSTFNIIETDETRSRVEFEILFPKQYSQTT